MPEYLKIYLALTFGWIVIAAFSPLGKIKNILSRLSRIEAKLDALLAHGGVKCDPYADVPPAVAEALMRGEKVQAIRAYSGSTGVDLEDARDYVEEVLRRAGKSD